MPVVCVGNFVAGGAGKTPTALALAELATQAGHRPGFLSRGHGGAATSPVLVTPEHSARSVGDEPLVLAERHPTAVSPDRPAGARLLVESGVDLIVMDDGFQNPHLRKDLNLAVVDARRGLGNGLPIPAGPLRATLDAQLARMDALVVIGEGEEAIHSIRQAARRARPILRARAEPLGGERFRGKRVLAYAGIGDPTKFFDTLRDCGAEVVEAPFPDHHPFTDEEAVELVERAEREDLTLVTTQKDAARLKGTHGRSSELLERSESLSIRLAFDDERAAERLLLRAVERARDRRLSCLREARA